MWVAWSFLSFSPPPRVVVTNKKLVFQPRGKTMADQEVGVTRRSLLKLTAAAGVVGALPAGSQAFASTQTAVPLGIGGAHLHYLAAKDFAPYLHTPFAVEVGLGRPLRMELSAVESFPAPPKDDGAIGECFALRFRQIEGATVPQGTYHFDHGKLGRASFLLVPGDRPKEYSVVINHRRPR